MSTDLTVFAVGFFIISAILAAPDVKERKKRIPLAVISLLFGALFLIINVILGLYK